MWTTILAAAMIVALLILTFVAWTISIMLCPSTMLHLTGVRRRPPAG
jgi:hypothetical protein